MHHIPQKQHTPAVLFKQEVPYFRFLYPGTDHYKHYG